jgi:hypothetical protein
METKKDEFAYVLHAWKIENNMPWGQLRYSTSRMNIAGCIRNNRLLLISTNELKFEAQLYSNPPRPAAAAIAAALESTPSF